LPSACPALVNHAAILIEQRSTTDVKPSDVLGHVDYGCENDRFDIAEVPELVNKGRDAIVEHAVTDLADEVLKEVRIPLAG
jgi:hypothetical protein